MNERRTNIIQSRLPSEGLASPAGDRLGFTEPHDAELPAGKINIAAVLANAAH